MLSRWASRRGRQKYNGRAALPRRSNQIMGKAAALPYQQFSKWFVPFSVSADIYR
jgi:hypothetical protein